MCLTFNKTEPAHRGERTVWKVLRFYSGELRSRYFRDHVWGSGENCSDRVNRQLTEIEMLCVQVKKGFHVYISKERAEATIRHIDNYVMVEMTVDSCDFVCENTAYNEAVYTKVTIPSEEFARVRDLFLQPGD